LSPCLLRSYRSLQFRSMRLDSRSSAARKFLWVFPALVGPEIP
jgi:hypothetical protein